MTLKSKFLKLYHKFAISDEWEGSLEDDAVKIADDFAIGFAEWIRVCKRKGRPYDFDNTKQLLKMYKIEKEL
jgi:hypothetical protein